MLFRSFPPKSPLLIAPRLPNLLAGVRCRRHVSEKIPAILVSFRHQSVVHALPLCSAHPMNPYFEFLPQCIDVFVLDPKHHSPTQHQPTTTTVPGRARARRPLHRLRRLAQHLSVPSQSPGNSCDDRPVHIRVASPSSASTPATHRRRASPQSTTPTASSPPPRHAASRRRLLQAQGPPEQRERPRPCRSLAVAAVSGSPPPPGTVNASWIVRSEIHGPN